MLETSPTRRAEAWLKDFGSALEARDIERAVGCFGTECYWRDLLSFTWNIKTLEGGEAIEAMLRATLAETSPRNWTLDGEAKASGDVVEAWFDFETAVARGRGHLRLRGGRCWTLLTTMTALKGHEEKAGERRIQGVVHGARKGRETWLERRTSEKAELGLSRQPYCVIIGGGQGGIALAARLKRLGVPTLILEKNARAGDSWRKRYRTLVLHDPVWYDHLPYLPFPDDWPVFAPKDKFADWLEAYTSIMELDYWPGTECTAARYDEARGEWEVSARRSGEDIVLRPKQLVLATGAYGPPKSIPLPGRDSFKGEIIHSSAYVTGELYRGKQCVVLGSGSSAHDICVDLWESGAEVTMVQRSPTIVVRSETLMELGFASLYSEAAVRAGITTDVADMIFASIPFALMPKFQKPLYDAIRERDTAFYERLAAAGFLLTFGDDESGLLMQALRTASNYYVDVGASDLIVERKIGLRSGVGVSRLREREVVLDDGAVLPADLVVEATGYRSMDAVVAKLVSPEIARKLGPLWGIGSGIRNDPGPWLGELRNMWKPTGQPGLWFHGGNLHLSRHYSLYLSLQIKARMEGFPTPVYGLA
jgi:putative flavoprotein involved in K+ transport